MPGGFQEDWISEFQEDWGVVRTWRRGLAFPWSVMRATEDSEQEVMTFDFNFNMASSSAVELRSDNNTLRAGAGRPIRALQELRQRWRAQ